VIELKKRLGLLILLVLSLGIVMAGCSVVGTGEINPPESEITPGSCEMLDVNELSPQIKHLLREYLYWSSYLKPAHSISRWPCGTIYVYDETRYEKTQELLNLANQLIAGPTVFKITKDPAKAKIKYVFKEGSPLEVGWGELKPDEYTAEYLSLVFYIPTEIEIEEIYNIYFSRTMRFLFFFSTRMTEEEWELLKKGEISENYKTVIYYGYRLPIGTEIDPNW